MDCLVYVKTKINVFSAGGWVSIFFPTTLEFTIEWIFCMDCLGRERATDVF